MPKTPELLSLNTIFRRLVAAGAGSGRYFYRDGFAVALDVSAFFVGIIRPGTPYLLEDYRIGFVNKGALRVVVNLREVTFAVGDVVFITPGTIVEPVSVSRDFQVEGIGLTADTFQLAHGDNVPPLFQGTMRDGRCRPTAEQHAMLDAMFHLFYALVDPGKGVSRDVLSAMVTTITNYLAQLFTTHPETADGSRRGSDIFNHFIRLVNLHCRTERSLAFYADRLCITERYLSTIVSHTSGITAKEWIDRAVVTAAKVMLRHSNRQVVQIADELRFSNPSFFCKYFRRLTGLTPQQYRAQK